MPLYGRTADLSELTARLARVRTTDRGQILAVQGRRQVGKSTLLTTFAQASEVPTIYFTAVKNQSMHQQLLRFRDAALDDSNGLPFGTRVMRFSDPPTSWTDAFNRIAITAQSNPLIVVLDEFPWAVEQSPTLEGELQVAWDSTLEHLPVLLVLVGSDVAMMDRLSDHDRPLFGRTQPLVINPLNPAELADALPHADAFELFDAYLMTGGYPRLVRSCADAGSAISYAHQSLSSATSDLVTTAKLTLAAEFTDSVAAQAVLTAIGANPVSTPTFNDVVAQLTDSPHDVAAKTAVTRALKVLSGSKRLIEVEVPAGAPSNSKLRRYVITDPYLRFWFAFVYGQDDNMSRGRADLALARFDRSWESWRGHAIEPVVRDAVLRLAARRPELAGVESVGSWWNRVGSAEVDLVGRDRRGVTALGTIKWRPTKRITRAEIDELDAARHLTCADDQAQLIAICPAGVVAGLPVTRLGQPATQLGQPSAPILHMDAADLLSAWSATPAKVQ